MAPSTAAFGGREWVSIHLQLNKGIWHARTAYLNAAGLLLSDRRKSSSLCRRWKYCTSGRRLLSSAALNAPSYHRFVYFCWQADSYFTTWLCPGPTVPCFHVPQTHTHKPPPSSPTLLHTASVHLSHCCIIHYVTWVQGEHVQDVMRECWWVGFERGEVRRGRRTERERCADETGRLKNMMKAPHEKRLWTNRSIITGVLKQLDLTANAIFQGNNIVALQKEKEVNPSVEKGADMKFQPLHKWSLTLLLFLALSS